MKIKYLKADKSIEITDGIILLHGLIYFIGLINLFNATIYFYNNKQQPFDSMHFIWICIIVVSLGLVLYQLLKKSTKKNILIDEIVEIKVKSWTGRNRVILKLKNGKERDLIELRSEPEIEKLRELVKIVSSDQSMDD